MEGASSSSTVELSSFFAFGPPALAQTPLRCMKEDCVYPGDAPRRNITTGGIAIMFIGGGLLVVILIVILLVILL